MPQIHNKAKVFTVMEISLGTIVTVCKQTKNVC